MQISIKGQHMNSNQAGIICVGAAVISLLGGCSTTATKSPDVSGSIRQSLNQPNLKDVSVSQDRDKGIVTLSGHVATDSDKAQAESIAKSIAAGEVVSDEIA